jgi:methionyl-tRNA synthetase
MKNTYYITTAIDYTNAAPHIGHAYEKVLADVMARFNRLKGGKVYFLTGVDQHGQKVKQAAEKQGVHPREFAEENTAKFLNLWSELGLSHDGWAATTDPRHGKAVQAILQSLHDKGALYKARHAGYYSVRQEQFLTDKERGPDGEFGPEWGEVVYLEEENWYFRLAEHKEWLLEFLRTHEDFVLPAFRRNELINAVEKLSGDLCISRPKERLSWGIEFPFDKGFVTYVWFDALINYVSFAGYLSEGSSGLPSFDDLWPCDAHVIGKDILIPAHGVYWPIMLHAMGFPDEAMPRLIVHGWWNIGGAKMSKSEGNIVDPAVLVKRYGADAVRYYLMRDIATGQDADFSEDRLRQRYNSDLANDLGNLLNRTLNMTARYRQGAVKRPAAPLPEAEALAARTKEAVATYISRMTEYQVHQALEAAWDAVTACNAFVDATAPWKLAKDPSAADALDAVLYTLADTLRVLAVLASPVIPTGAALIAEQLNLPKSALSEPLEGLADRRLPDGHVLGTPSPVFPRVEAEK